MDSESFLNLFPTGKVDLTQANLNCDQRKWIIEEMEKPEVTSNSVAQQLGLKPSYIRKILSRHRSGCIQRNKSGRPRAIDEISHSNIVKLVADNGPIEVEELKKILDYEYERSFSRAYPSQNLAELGNKRKLVRIPFNTQKRYLVEFANMIENSDDGSK
jgi:predicted transcriptional regulator of viral defense system